MKKTLSILFVFIFIACLFGCGEENVEFSIDDETKKLYGEKINEILKKDRWNYNEDRIFYEQGNVPDYETAGFEDVKRASLTGGLDIDGYEGSDAVRALVDIFYFNNEEAGKACFYFIDSDLVCEYYISGGNIYGISEVNVFANDVFLGKTENVNEKKDFYEVKTNKDFIEFNDMCRKTSVIGTISGEVVEFFKFNDGSFSLESKLDFSKESLFPMDISFDEEGNFAVLLGRKKKTEHQIIQSEEDIQEMRENGLTEAEINGMEILASDRIVFFDNNYKSIFKPCNLDVSSYSAIDFKSGAVFAARGKGVDVFSGENGNFSKTKQYVLKQWVEKIKSDDIDGDGIREFIMTDDTNLFLYRLDDVPLLVWKTHLSLKSMGGKFYVEDTNGDGIKEIYISDDFLKTSVKYALTDYGFKPFSADYGQEIIPGDFNGDGKTDYILIENDSEKFRLFICK